MNGGAKMTDTPLHSDPWLSVTEAADYAGLHPMRMRQLLADGKIPGAGRTQGDSGDWRVKASQIDAWFQQADEAPGA